ncbi:hypothetical protein NL676_033221 [Syzygium grande]|nr:hypothetical protein NL676_033221 [Syzygium grande]
MVSKMNMLVLMVFLGASIRCCSAQTTHVVGDSLGWVVPPGGAIAYSTWAANKTFIVGDTLVFNFTTQEHDVAKVTKAAFDSCDPTSPISLQTDGPASIALNQSGEHFFICTIGQHCNRGQKLAINVTSSSATTPSPSPATTPSSPPPASTPTPLSPSPATPPSSTATPPSTSTSPPPPTTTTTPPTSSTTPPPPGNSAASLSVTGLFSGILSIAVVLLY